MKFRLICTIIAGALVLQGCVGAVVVGTTAVATTTATDPRTLGTQVDDTTLNTKISGLISSDPQIKKQARIVATVYQRNVLLTGQSPSAELIQKAQKLTLSVKGIKHVYNEIRLGNPVSIGTLSQDSWITAKIRSQLLTSDQVKSTSVKVITENSEVFLLGVVSREEGNAAANVASQVSGVKRVIKAFNYLN